MSWNAYIDSVIAESGDSCDKVCLIGTDGSVWTNSEHPAHIAITANEAATIARCITTRDSSPLQASGVVIAGLKYQFLRDDENLILGKKKDNGSVTIVATKTVVIIAHTIEGKSQGKTNSGAGKIQDYFESIGY
jgi:Profilin.